MPRREHPLTKPKYQLNLLKLTWPIFIEGMTGGLVTLTDVWFLSQISDEVAASVGMIGAVLTLGYFVLPQFTSAGGSVAAQYLGAKKEEYATPTYIATLLIGLVMGGVLAAGIFSGAGSIGSWLGLNSAGNEYSRQYLSVIAFNFILVGLRSSYSAILSANTLTKWNMASAIVTNVLNIGLCYSFINGAGPFPKLGIPGVALATLISYFVGFAVYFYLVHFRLRVSFRPKKWLGKIRTVIGPILKVGLPSAMEPFSWTVQNFVVSVIIIKLGVAAMSANTYVLRLIFLDLTVSWALTAAGQIIISHQFGSKNYDEVNKTYLRILRYATAFAFVNILLYLVFSDQILSVFTHDPQIKQIGFWLLVLSLFIEPIRSVNILGGVVLKTVGDGKFSVVMAMVFMWGLIPLLLLASFWGWGIIGFWCCLLFDEAVRAGLNLWRWTQGKWRQRSVIHD